MMRVVVTGATGFIGTRLTEALRSAGHEVVTLGRGASADYSWDAGSDAPAEVFEGANAVVHLAGEPVAQRWTPEAKQRIYASRVDGTRNLINAISQNAHRPEVFV